MKKISDRIKNILLWLIIIILFLPMIQGKFNFVTINKLSGDIVPVEDSVFSMNGWLSRRFQKGRENFLNENFGFRNIFVRINNQLAFDLFRLAKANSVIIGKDNYFFEENYIKAYYGEDFITEDSIMQRLQKARFIQDTLKSMNKSLILVFTAGKGSFYPEYFPDNMVVEKGKTNYEYYVKYANELGLNSIDFNKYFVDHKYSSPYPLYPRYGIHWSYYGECLATDSIIKYIEKLRAIDMQNLFWNDVSVEDARDDDCDIENGMNLLFDLKKDKMGYPDVRTESDGSKTKPSVLVIADSFFWGLLNVGFSNSFSKMNFWFYNRQVYPDSQEKAISTRDLSLKKEIQNHDIIIILGAESTLHEFGWGFIEDANDMFHGKNKLSRNDTAYIRMLNKTMKDIKSDKNWYDTIVAKALRRKISPDSMLKVDAMWIIENSE